MSFDYGYKDLHKKITITLLYINTTYEKCDKIFIFIIMVVR